MITSLELRNFKAWEKAGPIRFAPITAFFGSNSSGKTSLIQSLLILKQTTDSADRGRVFDLGGGPASLVDLGTFQDIIYRHESNRSVGIELSWREDEPFEIQDPELEGQPVVLSDNNLSLTVNVTEYDATPTVDNVRYGLGNTAFELRRREDSRTEYQLSSNSYPFKRVSGRPWPLPPPGKFYSFPDQVRAYYQNASFLSYLELQFEKLCERMYYLGPLREDPKRQYIWSGGRPVDVGRRGELAIEALIASQRDGPVNSRGFTHRSDGSIHQKRRITLERHVASWLQELGLIASFAVEAVDNRVTLFRVTVRRSPNSSPVLLTDVGFGVSQVLPVLVLLAYAPKGSTVLLEQPEIHLHPAVQSKLADIIIETAKVRNIQIILESHSEHLLMRIQRRIAEKNLDNGIELLPEDCALYFCDLPNGSPRLNQLQLDRFGNITNWPEDFFGDSFGEAAATARAAHSRASSRDIA